MLIHTHTHIHIDPFAYMYEKHTKVATTFIPGAKNVLLLLLLGPKVPTILLVHVGLLLLWHAKAITTMALKLLIKRRNFLRF